MINSSEKLINVSSRQLLAFLEICRLGSFAKAANSVHISPSGLSMLVKELEEQVGARLFDRNTRSIALTEAGHRLNPVAVKILAELRMLSSAIAGTEAAVRVRLDIAATPMLSASMLPSVLREFTDRYPEIRVQLADTDVSNVRSRVLEGHADIGLGFFVKPAVGLLRQPLCNFQLMLISPLPPNLKGPVIDLCPNKSWASLSTIPLVSLPADNPIQILIETHLAKMNLACVDRPSANLIGTLIGMVEAGLGHAVIPSFAVNECLHRRLAVAMLVEPEVRLDLYMISRRGTRQKAAALEFAAVFKRVASELAA